MVGTLPSGYCLQGVRAEPQSPNETGHDMRVFGGMGKSIERKKNRGRSEPEPASAHSLSMSFPLAIPWRVALQQSLPPLRQPPPLCRNRIPTVQSRRPAHVLASPHRAGCRENLALSGQGRVFLLDIPSYRTRLSLPKRPDFGLAQRWRAFRPRATQASRGLRPQVLQHTGRHLQDVAVIGNRPIRRQLVYQSG
jgi:hypothetical protein